MTSAGEPLTTGLPGNLPRINYRERARRHFKAAEKLLASGDDGRLLYACLELRLTIESLAYEIVQLYREDLSDEMLRTWQADKVLKAVADFDPGADGTIRLIIENPRDGRTLELVDYRMTAKWARKAYPQLGSFLHERTLLQLETGGEVEAAEIRDRANRIADELGRVLESTGFGLRMLLKVGATCDCGVELTMKVGAQQRVGYARCDRCGARWEFKPQNPGRWEGKMWGRRCP